MTVRILVGDTRAHLSVLPDDSVDCCVTSPPYWGLRSYLENDDPDKQNEIGLEKTPGEYVDTLVGVFGQVRRILKPMGTLWLNLGDTFFSDGGHFDGDCRDRRGAYRVGRRPMDEYRAHRRQVAAGEAWGLKQKDLCLMPARVALALQADGWWLRSHIIWHKPNPMPESVKDRPTKSHESIFLLSREEKYYYDYKAVREPQEFQNATRDRKRSSGNKARVYDTPTRPNDHLASGVPWEDKDGKRNKRDVFRVHEEEWSQFLAWRAAQTPEKPDVWTVSAKAFPGPHYATFPPDLITPCILAGSPAGGTVLDPFGGAGTTGMVSDRLGRHAILVELKSSDADMAAERIRADGGMLAQVEVA